ncbi:MAG: hypothetical protein JEZ11_13120 [Desulfobacterales bacterium]|nr:hypothetical protein [Desulfobacterales bacterium]
MALSKNPLKKKPDKSAIDAFIAGADSDKKTAKAKPGHPWDDADPEVVKMFNLRIPKPLRLKLDYLAKAEGKSVHGFIMDAVEKAVGKRLKQVAG